MNHNNKSTSWVDPRLTEPPAQRGQQEHYRFDGQDSQRRSASISTTTPLRHLNEHNLSRNLFSPSIGTSLHHSTFSPSVTQHSAALFADAGVQQHSPAVNLNSETLDNLLGRISPLDQIQKKRKVNRVGSLDLGSTFESPRLMEHRPSLPAFLDVCLDDPNFLNIDDADMSDLLNTFGE